jgi:hypothetical protein
VQCELSLALELKKPIFPLLLEGRRWLSVAAIQSVDVTGKQLPPPRFFDTVRGYFSTATMAESLSVQAVAKGEPPKFAGALFARHGKLTTRKSTNIEVELKSEKGIDYTRLRALLEAGEWKAADQETADKMLKAIGKDRWSKVQSSDLLNFPCADLTTIDHLWNRYSNGKWGFSVQKEIYVECGATPDGTYSGDSVWRDFCRRVGWLRGKNYVSYSDLTFDLQNSPAGEFPCFVGVRESLAFRGWVGWGLGGFGFSSLASRLVTCRR